jgi:hypothetical protein
MRDDDWYTPKQGTAHIPESWSPDGRVLLFAEAKGATNYTIWTLSFPGRKKARFGDIESPRPPSATFSSDGRWVAYTSSETSAAPTVFVQPFPATGVKIPIARNAFHPLWSPDGASLYYRLIGTRSEVVTVKKTPAFSFGTPRAASIEVLGRLETLHDSSTSSQTASGSSGLSAPADSKPERFRRFTLC